MKTLEIAYCLIKKGSRKKYPNKFSPLLLEATMPIFWLKSTAQNEAKKFDCDVLKVIVEPFDNLK